MENNVFVSSPRRVIVGSSTSSDLGILAAAISDAVSDSDRIRRLLTEAIDVLAPYRLAVLDLGLAQHLDLGCGIKLFDAADALIGEAVAGVVALSVGPGGEVLADPGAPTARSDVIAAIKAHNKAVTSTYRKEIATAKKIAGSREALAGLIDQRLDARITAFNQLIDQRLDARLVKDGPVVEAEFSIAQQMYGGDGSVLETQGYEDGQTIDIAKNWSAFPIYLLANDINATLMARVPAYLNAVGEYYIPALKEDRNIVDHSAALAYREIQFVVYVDDYVSAHGPRLWGEFHEDLYDGIDARNLFLSIEPRSEMGVAILAHPSIKESLEEQRAADQEAEKGGGSS